MNDLRFAFRQLRKSPAFTFIAVVTLALGIGANTAMFSIVHAVLLRPLPYPQPDRIVAVHESAPGQSSVSLSFPDYIDFRRDATSFQDGLALSRFDGDSLSGVSNRPPEHVAVASVTANFFRVIGLAPQLGRTFTEEEDKRGGPLVVVLSDRLWQRIFNRDPDVLGRAIRLHDRPFTVIGVMPAAMMSPQNTDAWVPLMPRASNGIWESRAIHPMLFGWGRLRDGATLDQARAEMRTISARLEKQYLDVNKGISSVVSPLIEDIVGDYRQNLTLLLGAVALVLLIACANLANLFAARGAARAREFAIRAAVGANRARIIRQLLIESALVALAGGAFGFCISVWSRDALVAMAPPGIERFRELSFDGRVLTFTFLLASLTAVLFGLWPAWNSSRTNLQLALHGGSRTSDSRAAGRTRDWLVIGEIALTLVLLSSAGLVLKSFANAQALSLGYEPRNLLTARIDLVWTNYRDRQKVTNFAHAALDKLRALPGVQSVALGSNPPLMGGFQISFVREDVEMTPADQPSAESEVVAGDYFATLKASLLRGRTFSDRDNKDAPLVTIIDQALAEQYFPGEDPIGKRLSMHPDDVGNDNRLYEIVGVVAPMKYHGAGDPMVMPVVVFPQPQVERTNFVLLVRAANISNLERPIRQIITSIDPAQPVYDVRPMLDRVRDTWATQRLLSFLLTVFAGLALGLATIGLYGVIAYTAVGRLREIGVRLALGAQRSHIRALILGHGVRLLTVGLVSGFAAAAGTSRLLSSFLFNVRALDPLTYVAGALLLGTATLFACWLPARRAARVDPIITLRAE